MYQYVGPPEILRRVGTSPAGFPVRSKADVEHWGRRHRVGGAPLPATFVIDGAGVLLLVDRHSEHVVCAGGAPVLAAGELVLEIDPGLRITSITNQSTGYCPDEGSWGAVKKTLAGLNLDFPPSFTPAFTFRRCEACGQINVVKDADFTCSMCLHELPERWNF